jgi:hypothetical protein
MTQRRSATSASAASASTAGQAGPGPQVAASRARAMAASTADGRVVVLQVEASRTPSGGTAAWAGAAAKASRP